MAAQIRIGTSGWHYKHWCGPFYPKKCPSSQWFELCARVFDTVEVNNTFYRLPTEDALRRHKIALCIHDWRGSQSPVELTADFTYIRFHGATGKYQGNYGEPFLRNWAERIKGWATHLSHIYAYFNNDQHGYAVNNAQTLQHLLHRELSRAA